MKPEKNVVIKWLALLVLVALSMATMYSLKTADRFSVIEEQLLVDSQFSDESASWEYTDPSIISFIDGYLVFQSDAMSSSKVVQSVTEVDIDTPAFVRLTFDASSENILAEDRAGAGGGVLLVSRDDQGEVLSGERLLLLDGSNENKTYSRIEILEAPPKSIEVIFRLDHSEGTFSVSSPVLSVLSENDKYKVMKAVYLCVWLIVALLLIKVAMTVLSVWQSIVLFLLFGVTLVGVLLPEPIIQSVTHKVGSLLPEQVQSGMLEKLALVYPAGSLSDSGALVSKAGHFFAFFAIGLFAGLCRRKFGFCFVLAGVVVFALMTEAIQMFVFGRTTSIADLVLDCSAGILGVLLGAAFTLIVFVTKEPVSDLK